jgi:hypothetical protein
VTRAAKLTPTKRKVEKLPTQSAYEDGPMTLDTHAEWHVLYEALAAAALRNLEDAEAARDALAAVDERWRNDRLAWILAGSLTEFAYEKKREGEHAGGRAKSVSNVAYYTALRLQDDLRRLGLHRPSAAASR